MKWNVIWTRPALHDLRRLDRQLEERVRVAVRRLAETEQGDVTRLQGEDPPQWRLRVGDWRVRFRFDPATSTIFVQRVLPRGRAYRD
ncbi:MAG: type II toxin-antitoxin system RelE/ParE family toxin [Chloroflexota bacterium]|nr:type II toxin-antitoxin system RelE/ParE family toxin [Chloroflexota bacterium]